MRHAFPLLLPLTSAFNTDFSPRTSARAQRRAAIYSFGNENEHTVENVGLGDRFLDPLIYVMIMSSELNSSYCTHDGFSCGPGFQPQAGSGLYRSRYCSRAMEVRASSFGWRSSRAWRNPARPAKGVRKMCIYVIDRIKHTALCKAFTLQNMPCLCFQ